MKKTFLIIIFTTFTAISSVHGEEPNKNVHELSKVLGFESIVASAKQNNKIMAEKELNSVINQIKINNPKISSETETALKQAGQKYIDRIVSSWDPAEVTKMYIGSISEGLNDSQINSAIDYYSTPRGQTELSTIFKAVSKVQEYISRRREKETEPALKELFSDMKLILQKSSQNRTPPPFKLFDVQPSAAAGKLAAP